MKVYIVFEAENNTGFRGASTVLGVFADQNAAESLRKQREDEIYADVATKLEGGFYLRPETAHDHAETVYIEAHDLT